MLSSDVSVMETSVRRKRARVVARPASAKKRTKRAARVGVVTPRETHKSSECSPRSYKLPPFPPVWKEFRENRHFCDVKITTSDNKVHLTNRGILAAVSPYFRTVFTNWLKGDCRETRVSVDMPSAVVDILLNFAYTGECEVTRDNVQHLLPAADKFEFPGVVAACCGFLVRELSVDNCVGIMQFSKVYFMSDLEATTMRFMRQHFTEVATSAQFTLLTFSEVHSLLGHDELNTRYEEVVFEAAVSWIDNDPDTRERYLPRLLRCVRYGLLNALYLRDVVLVCPYLRRNRALLEAVGPRAVLLCELQGAQVDLSLPMSRPRVPGEVVFTVGGWRDGAPTNVIETYDTRADRWLLCTTDVPLNCAYHGLCALDGLIYMVGGMDGEMSFNTTLTFDPVSRRWRRRSCMHVARAYVSVAVLDGRVYAVGGYDGRDRLETAERYSPALNQWSVIGDMTMPRSDAAAASLHGRLFVVGGFTGDEVLPTAEVYDPRADQWTRLPDLLGPRSGLGLVALRGALYAVGGFDGVSRMQTVERLDPRRDARWCTVAEMFSPRSNFATVVLDDMIFAMGGFDGSTTITLVECYDEAAGEWYGAANLQLNRSALGACVVHGLPNIREYSMANFLANPMRRARRQQAHLDTAAEETLIAVTHT